MKMLTPIKAIRAKCIDCCCGQLVEVRLCGITDCALYPYRMGHRPKKNKNGIKIEAEIEEADCEEKIENEETATIVEEKT